MIGVCALGVLGSDGIPNRCDEDLPLGKTFELRGFLIIGA